MLLGFFPVLITLSYSNPSLEGFLTFRPLRVFVVSPVGSAALVVVVFPVCTGGVSLLVFGAVSTSDCVSGYVRLSSSESSPLSVGFVDLRRNFRFLIYLDPPLSTWYDRIPTFFRCGLSSISFPLSGSVVFLRYLLVLTG